MRLAANVPSSVPPAGVTSALPGSSLIVIVTSPVATNCRRATMSTPTSDTITNVNIATPRAIVTMTRAALPQMP